MVWGSHELVNGGRKCSSSSLLRLLAQPRVVYKIRLAIGRPPILERWLFVPPLISSFVDAVPSPPLPPEKPINRDFYWRHVKRRPVFRESLVVIVNLEALGTNSGDVLKIISRPKNCRINFLLWVGIGRRCFGAILV